jgi:microcystin-dependent protein
MTFWKWSRTAASNANSDSSIDWAEGMDPAAINDSGRAMMAAAAKYRDDVAGAITTGGTSTAYTVSSYQSFDSLAHLDGAVIAFTPHVTNDDAPTLNVDGLGARYLRGTSGANLPAGVLVAGTPYMALYNNIGEFTLHGYFGDPYAIPIGASVDFWAASAPNSSFALMYGQAISRTTYSTLFALLGTTYGTGDGSTTFNIPDLRGRGTAGKDDMGGTSASRLTSSWFGVSAATLGAVGGNEKNALSSINQIPQFTPAGSISNGAISFPAASVSSASGGGNSITTGGFSAVTSLTLALAASQATSTFTGTPTGSASPSSFAVCQPTIICNKLLRII